MKNLVTLPYDSIKKHFSEKEYDRVEEKSLSLSTLEKSSYQLSLCDTSPEQSLPDLPLNQLEDLSQNTRDLVCSCKPWGDCEKGLCSCKKLCPDNFEIFKKPPFENNIRELTSYSHSLSFRNSGAMKASSIRGTSGYCWGHASVTSKFNRLAFFDPSDDSLKRQLESAPDSLQRKYAIQEYKKIVDAIVDNKVKTIPGFSNLYELSRHPDLQTYIADKVAKSWANRAMSLQGMFTALKDSPMKRDESEALFQEVQNKIDTNQQPQIVFTDKDEKFKTHAVLVSHIEESDGMKKLCIRDNNESPFRNEFCENYMYISEEGSIVYNDDLNPSNRYWGELGSVKLAHNDDSDAIEQFHSLREHCADQKDCPIQ